MTKHKSPLLQVPTNSQLTVSNTYDMLRKLGSMPCRIVAHSEL